MKKVTAIAIISLALTFSLPALAGPNWDVIHRAEANKAAHEHKQELVLPLDYGPRAVTTPWLNHVRLGELVSQVETESKLARAHAGKKAVVAATRGHHKLPNHS